MVLSLLVAAPVATVDVASGASGADQAWTVPTRPATCTPEAMARGDVAGCIVWEHGSPARRGFGSLPDPSVTPGFRFDGWSYHGPGVEAAATEMISANPVAVAGRRAGTLRTHVAAAALFEGFLDEVHGRGYPIRDAVGFVYRCTSGSGGRCDAGTMSLHAWGLAVDINAAANPERVYRATGERDDGVSACAVPMQTDIPRWVVEAAERWGLYWGGYGWSSDGCTAPDRWSDRVRRDPHHFEFRGTVDTALAIARRNGRPSHPMYCTVTVDDRGRDQRTCNRTGVPGAGTRSPVPLDPPADAVAAIVNITAVGARSPGFLTAESCSAPLEGPRTTSNTNFEIDAAAPSTAVVPLGPGRVCIWRSAPVHTLVDVVGWLIAEPTGSRRGSSAGAERIVPTTASRALDTRRSGPIPAAERHRYPLEAPSGAIVNVTALDAPAAGFVTADRCSALGTNAPGVSTVNHLVTTARANLTFVGSEVADGRSQSCLWSSAGAHALVDVVARLGPDGLGVVPIEATRRLDTRQCGRAGCPTAGAGQVVEVPGTGGAGVVVNVTVTGSASAGFVTAAPCSSLRPGAMPATSTVNFPAGGTVANLAIVTGGPLCVQSSTPAHLIVDVQARLDPTGGAGVRLTDQVRRLDTRR